jgi:hypothetical protein
MRTYPSPMNAPTLLNDDGSASMATALMMSHHGFRRDIDRFGKALAALPAADQTRAVAVPSAEALGALKEEWQFFHNALHGHHHAEDTGLFPNLQKEHAELAALFAKLTDDHRHIDPLLERGDRAFAKLPDKADAIAVVAELSTLLEAHLATEEAQVVQFLRPSKAFPSPATDAEADMYAQGFAWACDGIAPEVLERLYAMLPDGLTSRLPAARAAFEARCRRVWGSVAPAESRKPVPSWLPGG